MRRQGARYAWSYHQRLHRKACVECSGSQFAWPRMLRIIGRHATEMCARTRGARMAGHPRV
eukprot:8837593-Alexandrium_andersonii.AAC.1